MSSQAASSQAAPAVPEAAPDLLLVCRTCPRFAQGQGWMAETRGMQLGAAVRERWGRWAAAAGFALRVVACLGGCPNPCNAALSGAGKWRLRIRHLTPADADVLLELAAAYRAHADGNLQPGEIPAPLRERIGARTPPYAALSAAASGAQQQAGG